MVSSKCSQVESPSPLVLTAPLMPPCAQTECERFTGTTENRSTEWPASAIFIAAASPASLPPTTAILIPAISSKNSSQQSSRMNESYCGINADRQKENPKGNAGITGKTLRALADNDSPINQEEPNAVRQVPYGRSDSD